MILSIISNDVTYLLVGVAYKERKINMAAPICVKKNFCSIFIQIFTELSEIGLILKSDKK